MTQQRQAFEACIESFKCSAAAQMELQLVQLSVSLPFLAASLFAALDHRSLSFFLTASAQKAHENESVHAAKALNDNKKTVLELKKKNAELNARLSQMETQALQPRSVDPGCGNLGELQAKLEHAGLQMQVCTLASSCFDNKVTFCLRCAAGILECD
jgi:hypothetical protein